MPQKYLGNLNALRAYYFPDMNAAPVFTSQQSRRGAWSQSSLNTPKFYSLSRAAKRALPWHAYSYSYENWDFEPGVVSGKNGPTLTATFVGQAFAASGYTYSPWSTGTYNRWPDPGTKAKALASVQSKISSMSMNLAQAIAERRQTVSLIGNTVRRLVQLALWIKKGDFKSIHARYGLPKPKKTRSGGYVVPDYYREVTRVVVYGEDGQPLINKKGLPKKRVSVIYRDRKRPEGRWSFSDLWLEYSYGWKPLLSDVYGAADVLSKIHRNRKPIRFTGMASGIVKVEDYFAEWPINGSYYRSYLSALYADRARYVIEVVEDLDPVKGFAEVGLTNPLNLAWEVLPYSFVLDWFIPLGNYLEQLEYARGVIFSRGAVSWQRSALGTVRSKLDRVVPGYLAGSISGLNIGIEYRYKSREILTSFPYQEFPSFQPKLGVERVLSGISLLNQILTRGKTTVRI